MEEQKKVPSTTTTTQTTILSIPTEFLEKWKKEQEEKIKNRRTKIVFDKEGDYVIQFEWQHNEDDFPHWVNFKIMRACSGPSADTNSLVFYNYDLGRGLETEEHNIEDFDKYCKEDYDDFNGLGRGFIKWDGCMELHDINYHFCYYDNILDRITKEVYRQGAEIMQDRFEGTII